MISSHTYCYDTISNRKKGAISLGNFGQGRTVPFVCGVNGGVNPGGG